MTYLYCKTGGLYQIQHISASFCF